MQKNNYKIRPATKADVEKYYPDLQYSVRAWTLEVEGILAGVGGVFLVPGSYTAFLHVDNDVKLSKITLTRAIIEGMKMIQKMGLRISAVRDECLGTSKNLLESFGFEYSHKENAKEIYIWHKQH